MARVNSAELQQALQERFGFSSFRPGQQDVMAAVLGDRDCVAVLPTGGGKSLCFQLPAVLRRGLTLVISPLIALMKDQVDSLERTGIEATFINSSLDPGRLHERMDALAQGRYRLVYVAPERFRNPRFCELLPRVPRQRSAELAGVRIPDLTPRGHDPTAIGREAGSGVLVARKRVD